MELFIGIEEEGLWRGKEGSHLPSVSGGIMNTKIFTDSLVSCFNEKLGTHRLCADFSREAHPGHSENDVSDWKFAMEETVGAFPLRHPLELVSPKMTFGRDSTWREEVRKVWNTLLQIAEVEINQMCATHVHVSPKETKIWDLDQLKKIAKAVVYFENAFDIISTPSRRAHRFTHTNKSGNIKLSSLTIEECCDKIARCKNALQLINIMQSSRDKPTPSREFAWNFQNTALEGVRGEPILGTIEFRRAPGVTKAEHCLIWVELAVSFVQAAVTIDIQQAAAQYKPTVQGLKDFMTKTTVPNMNEKKYLDIVFYPHLDLGIEIETDEQLAEIFDERLKVLEG